MKFYTLQHLSTRLWLPFQKRSRPEAFWPLLGTNLASITKACACAEGTTAVMAALLSETKSTSLAYQREQVLS